MVFQLNPSRRATAPFGAWQAMADPKDPVIQDDVIYEEGVHKHPPTQSPAVQDEEDQSGITRDDSVDQMLEEVGIKREPGTTLAEKIEKDAKAEQAGEAEEPEDKTESGNT